MPTTDQRPPCAGLLAVHFIVAPQALLAPPPLSRLTGWAATETLAVTDDQPRKTFLQAVDSYFRRTQRWTDVHHVLTGPVLTLIHDHAWPPSGGDRYYAIAGRSGVSLHLWRADYTMLEPVQEDLSAHEVMALTRWMAEHAARHLPLAFAGGPQPT